MFQNFFRVKRFFGERALDISRNFNWTKSKSKLICQIFTNNKYLKIRLFIDASISSYTSNDIVNVINHCSKLINYRQLFFTRPKGKEKFAQCQAI
jgi:hypothetical protein